MKRLWLLVLALMLVVAGSLLNLDPILPKRAPGQTTDALHFPTGVLLSLLVYYCFGRSPQRIWQLLAASALLFGAIELIQPYFGRGASWGDWGFNLAGVALGALWMHHWSQPRLKIGLFLAIISMQVWAAYPVWRQLHG